mmetsp:Transcript_13081/g.36158  ORF Transcript_13081/g.36158 Transcript_13081/m.36158 type:complete len:137 (+) Transcript_13081:2-412(+)
MRQSTFDGLNLSLEKDTGLDETALGSLNISLDFQQDFARCPSCSSAPSGQLELSHPDLYDSDSHYQDKSAPDPDIHAQIIDFDGVADLCMGDWEVQIELLRCFCEQVQQHTSCLSSSEMVSDPQRICFHAVHQSCY